MKTLKPMKVGVVVRPFSHRNRNVLAVGLFLYVPFPPSTGVLTEVSMWKAAAKDVPDGVLDLGMPKPQGEWLIDGRAYGPQGAPTAAVKVRARVGDRERALLVTGDRYWEPNSGAVSAIRPFTEMPLTWAQAYGGPDFARNPLGRGHKPVETPHGPVHWLPNVEDPERRMRSPRDRAEPVGFGALDVAWPQRMGKAGTYDDVWLQRDFPGLAADVDWTMFQCAQEAQWVPAWRGDETFEFEGMHPTKAVVSGALPNLRTRAFVTRDVDGEERFLEVPMKLETVRFLPHRERAILLFRGVTECTEDDGSDVKVLLAACERVGEPKPVEHYVAVQARRMDRERGGLAALKDSDLMPEGSRVSPPSVADEDRSDMEEIVRTEGLLAQNFKRRRAREVEALRRQLEEAGMDPATALDPAWADPDEPAPLTSDLENLPEEMERLEREGRAKETEARARAAEMEADAKRMCAELGVSWEEWQKSGKANASGPPKQSVRAEMEALRRAALEANDGVPVPELEAMFEDESFLRDLDTMQARAMEGYRLGAHLMEPAARLSAEASANVRTRVIDALAAGRSLAGWDLTGADLSCLDLRDADLTEALCESCTFAGSVLHGVKFARAVLAHTDLTGAQLQGATLTGANLGRARGHDADFSDADLTNAILANADLERSIFDRCDLTRVDGHELRLAGARLHDAKVPQFIVMGANLRGADFTGADLTESLFLRCEAAGVIFERATLTKVAMIESDFSNAKLRGARANNLRVVLNTRMPGADLADAVLDMASLRATDFTGADFSRASLDTADISEAKLVGARLWRVRARHARFARADLTDAFLQGGDFMEALFTYADVTRADFTDTNLYGVDFGRIRGGVKSMMDALTTRAKVLPRRASP